MIPTCLISLPNLRNTLTGKEKSLLFRSMLMGTDFQKKVWSELLKIPYGKLMTYKAIAIMLGNENAMRAVGRANATNHAPIIIPCHRVIASDGKLGGYSGGVSLKEKLLELEGSLSLELFE